VDQASESQLGGVASKRTEENEFITIQATIIATPTVDRRCSTGDMKVWTGYDSMGMANSGIMKVLLGDMSNLAIRQEYFGRTYRNVLQLAEDIVNICWYLYP
jgi:hypothetical protein